MKTRLLDRRTVLRGLGGITVGLPLFEEMLVSTASAATPAVPMRSFNLFFGLGLPAAIQKEGFEGVMEPLKHLADKLLILRGIDQIRADQKGENAHRDGASAAFTAEAPNGTDRAGGPSLDQVIRAAHYANGLPAGMVPSLVAGTYFRRDRVARHTHSFNEDGTAAAPIQERPRDLFERVFGKLPGSEGDPAELRRKRSVLDTVLDQYHHYAGANSPLGSASKARLADHLDRIREYETRVFPAKEEEAPLTVTGLPTAGLPGPPPKSKLLHGTTADPGGEGIDITLTDLVEGWHLMAGLYALAIQTDRVRFGSLTFCAAGERIRLKGDYDYAGRRVFQFDDAGQRKKSGAAGCSHEWWHGFDEKKTNEALRAHAHMKLREIAWFLDLMDSEESREGNGRTILENSLFTISTESGDGRHNDVKRELSGVFHAVTGAGGRFKTGRILDDGTEALDLYNTLLGAMGTKRRLGPGNREHRRFDAILA